MAVITINEISKNYSFATGTSSFATVAFPITSMWGPGYFDPEVSIVSGIHCDRFQSKADRYNAMLDKTTWQRFSANQAGLESFISTYRGPVANYRLYNDYSYYLAVTLLSAGYDILVCRLSPGNYASTTFQLIKPNQLDQTTNPPTYDNLGEVEVSAKYPGTFGNNIRVDFVRKVSTINTGKTTEPEKIYYWNVIVYILDGTGTRNAVENKVLTFHVEDSTDNIPYWQEVEFDYINIDSVKGPGGSVNAEFDDKVEDTSGKVVELRPLVDQSQAIARTKVYTYSVLSGGSDEEDPNQSASTVIKPAILEYAEQRYPTTSTAAENTGIYYTSNERQYITALQQLSTNDNNKNKLNAIRFREWVFTHAVGGIVKASSGDVGGAFGGVYDLLQDKLTYNPQRVISPGWDDQDFLYIYDLYDTTRLCEKNIKLVATSPMHRKLMNVAYTSRCATALIDIPRSVDKTEVYADGPNFSDWGYAQKLSRYIPDNSTYAVDMQLFPSHSALFTCWGRYTYAMLNRQYIASPSFLALMIQRAMILNQALQYEWILPIDRKQNLRIGKMDYDMSQKILNEWQTTEGVAVNCITRVPDLGTTIWGNSTLFEVPPATYQALANLSTRYLVNAVEDVVYKVGIGITFQYNNSEAYSSFVAGCLPILDTMKNAGAINDYLIKMSMDINELDQVNANSVIGKIYLVINGVINDITVDLIALPPNTNLDMYR